MRHAEQATSSFLSRLYLSSVVDVGSKLFILRINIRAERREKKGEREWAHKWEVCVFGNGITWAMFKRTVIAKPKAVIDLNGRQ